MHFEERVCGGFLAPFTPATNEIIATCMFVVPTSSHLEICPCLTANEMVEALSTLPQCFGYERHDQSRAGSLEARCYKVLRDTYRTYRRRGETEGET